MTPTQVVRHFGSVSAAARSLNYTRAAIAQWKRKGKVPHRAQRYIESETGGELRANKGNGK